MVASNPLYQRYSAAYAETVGEGLQQLLLDTAVGLRAGNTRQRRVKSKRVARSYGGSEFTGPLWDVTIPGAQRLVPFLLWYVNQTGVEVKQIISQQDGLRVDWMLSVNGDVRVRNTNVIPYVSEEAKRLCTSGEWADIGGGVQMKVATAFLLPAITKQGDAAVLQWTRPPVVRWNRFLVRQVEFALSRITVTATGGVVDTTSALKNWILPDLTWGA